MLHAVRLQYKGFVLHRATNPGEREIGCRTGIRDSALPELA